MIETHPGESLQRLKHDGKATHPGDGLEQAVGGDHHQLQARHNWQRPLHLPSKSGLFLLLFFAVLYKGTLLLGISRSFRSLTSGSGITGSSLQAARAGTSLCPPFKTFVYKPGAALSFHLWTIWITAVTMK